MNEKTFNLNTNAENLKIFLLNNYYKRNFRIPKLNKDIISVINDYAISNFGKKTQHQHINDKLETQFLIRVIDFNSILKFINESLKKELEKGRNKILDTEKKSYQNYTSFAEKSDGLYDTVQKIRNLRKSLYDLKYDTQAIKDYKHLLDINHHAINFEKMLFESKKSNYVQPISESDKKKAEIADMHLSFFLVDDRPVELLTNFLNKVAGDKNLEFIKEYIINNVSNIVAKGGALKKIYTKKRKTNKRKKLTKGRKNSL
jgi:hypothetical protein